MTIREQYYDKAKELLQENPRLSSSEIMRRLGYLGSRETFRSLITKPINRELGIQSIHSRKHHSPSTDSYIKSDKQMESFASYLNEVGDFAAFTDGNYLNTDPVEISPGRSALVFGDTHIGYHSTELCMAPLRWAKERGDIDTIFLNGDIADCEAFSRHGNIMYEKMRFKDEKEQVLSYLNIIRRMFPQAEIYYAMGNHEFRAQAYLMNHAKALEGSFDLREQFRLREFGITPIPFEKSIKLGSLYIAHGHQFKAGGNNIAATVLNKLKCNILFNHFHRSQSDTATTFEGKTIGAWAIGCSCPLEMPYSLFNPQASNGFAHVQSETDGTFTVDNMKLIKGKYY